MRFLSATAIDAAHPTGSSDSGAAAAKAVDADGFRGVAGVAADAVKITLTSGGSTALPSLADIKYTVLDIEGTTTPIAFVTKTLFPYAKAKVGQYLTAGWTSAEVQADVAALKAQADADVAASVAAVVPINLSGSVAVRSCPACSTLAVNGVLHQLVCGATRRTKSPALSQTWSGRCPLTGRSVR